LANGELRRDFHDSGRRVLSQINRRLVVPKGICFEAVQAFSSAESAASRALSCV